MSYAKMSDLIVPVAKFDRHVEYNQQHGIPFVRLTSEPRVFKDIPKSKISEDDNTVADKKSREERIIEQAREELDKSIAEAKKKTLQRLLAFRIGD